MGVLGFPQAARHAQGVPNGSVWFVAAVGPQLGHEHQPLSVIRAVGCQAVQERRPDVFLVVGTTELDQLGEFAVVTFDVRVGGHEGVGSQGRQNKAGGARLVPLVVILTTLASWVQNARSDGYDSWKMSHAGLPVVAWFRAGWVVAGGALDDVASVSGSGRKRAPGAFYGLWGWVPCGRLGRPQAF